MTSTSPPERVCLVTVGATVGFPSLTSVVLQPAFWKVLKSHGFTSLRVQCGPDIESASKDFTTRPDDVPKAFDVEVFERRRNLMKEEMVLCKAAEGRSQGLIISHAGQYAWIHAARKGSLLY